MPQQALHALGEGAVGGVEVAAQRAAERLVEKLAMLVEALFERAADPRLAIGAAIAKEAQSAPTPAGSFGTTSNRSPSASMQRMTDR